MGSGKFLPSFFFHDSTSGFQVRTGNGGNYRLARRKYRGTFQDFDPKLPADFIPPLRSKFGPVEFLVISRRKLRLFPSLFVPFRAFINEINNNRPRDD